jgi:hypothetical protein
MKGLMTTEMFSRVAALIFALGALAQLSRAVIGFGMMAGSMMVPVWLSWLAFVLLAGLAYVGFTAQRE